jgi:hypothetical protein
MMIFLLPLTQFIPFLVLSLIMIIVIAISYYFSVKNKILKELNKTKAKSIISVKENEYVKIVGKARHVGEPLVAPISGKQCIYYQTLVETKGKHSRTLIDETKTSDFFIESGGQMAIVKTDQPNSFRRVFLTKDTIKSSGFLNDASHRLEAYLKRHNKESTNLLGFNRSMGYEEGIIELGEEVVVKGIGKWKTIKEPIEGFSYSKILTLTGSLEKKLLITDLEKAKKTSQ